MKNKVAFVLSMLLLGGVCSLLFARWFPVLPALIGPPAAPFYAVVLHEGRLALVAQLDDHQPWVLVDSTRAEIDLRDCRCPILPPDADLSHLQRYAKLEFLEVKQLSDTQFQLDASRDDLGGPKVRFQYRCGSTGLKPLLGSDEVLGILFPRWGWKYLVTFSLLWLAAASGVRWMLSSFRTARHRP
jgi:hypothetical protein